MFPGARTFATLKERPTTVETSSPVNLTLPLVDASDPATTERLRLEALQRYDILDTPAEQSFDRVTNLARKLFRMPIALVTLIDGHRQWFKSRQGLSSEETPRSSAICAVAIQSHEPLIVEDVRKDPRFADGPYVEEEPFVRFYAGAPLVTPDGHALGTLCVLDHKPRRFGPRQTEVLRQLAGVVMDEIELRVAANTDALTGALSRRAFRAEGERASHLAARHGHDISLAAIDLDHFKRVNDTYGHPAGDAVLSRCVDICLAQLRKSDFIGRLGGEEFAVLLPYSGPRAAYEVAERLRASISAETFEAGGRVFSVTASIGVVGRSAATPRLEDMIREADAALYEAKARGRNCCVLAETRDYAPSLDGGRRVMKSGRILSADGETPIECTVRALSRNGASLDVLAADEVPASFELAVEGEGPVMSCRIVRQAEKQVEVEFS